MGSETRRNGSAAVFLHQGKAAQRAYDIMIYGQGNHIAM